MSLELLVPAREGRLPSVLPSLPLRELPSSSKSATPTGFFYIHCRHHTTSMRAAAVIVGVDIKHIELEERIDMPHTADQHTSGQIDVSFYKDELETDFAIVDATRLLRYEDTGFFVLADRWKVKIMFHYVTPLGLEFAKACGIIK